MLYFYNWKMSNSLDIELSLATGVLAFGVNKFMYDGPTQESAMDGAMMAGANLVAQGIGLSDLIPAPAGLMHITDSLGTGLVYAAGNRFITHTTPFNSFWAQTLYGTALDFMAEHVVLPAINPR
jgi:hypothetical protein